MFWIVVGYRLLNTYVVQLIASLHCSSYRKLYNKYTENRRQWSSGYSKQSFDQKTIARSLVNSQHRNTAAAVRARIYHQSIIHSVSAHHQVHGQATNNKLSTVATIIIISSSSSSSTGEDELRRIADHPASYLPSSPS